MRTPGTWLAVLALGVLLSGAGIARAQDIVVQAGIEPSTVEVGGQAMLTIQVEGKFRRSASPELPPLPDFDVYEAGTSQNFSFVNGQVHSSITFNYVLSPRREGAFKIEPIRFSIGDKQYDANPVMLTVVAAGPGVGVPRGTAPAPSNRERGDLPAEDESIFVAASIDRDTVYVNEQVTWTLGYYTDGRVELLRSPNYSPPSSEGFWVEDLPPQNKYYENIHGRQYLVSEIKRAYFPTAPGTYTIGEARVDIVVDDFGRMNARDLFNRGLRGGFGQARSLNTEKQRVVVLPLPPAGKPSDFQGAVAENLTVSVSADKPSVHVGEPVNVVVEINGTGNMRTLGTPRLPGVDRFKVYESGNSTDSFKQDYVVSGRRKFTFVLVPQVEGQFTIPPVRVPYFDTKRRAYQVAQSSPLPLRVEPGTNEGGRKVIYAGGGDDFEVLNRDIRFIHAVPAGLAAGGRPFYTRTWFAAAQALPVLALVVSVLVERRRRRLRDDVAFARSSRALRAAERKLSAADEAFGRGDMEAGFGAVHAAVFGYFADKTNAPVAGLTRDAIEAALRARGAGEPVVDGIRRVIAACDAARYAAAAMRPEDGREAALAARAALAAAEKGGAR
jgi:hypothetical protein